MIKAIILDFDGTIIDTETPWYEAMCNAYRQHGQELSLEQYSLCLGTSFAAFNPYEYLMTDLGLAIDKEEFRSGVYAEYATIMTGVEMRDGVQRLLDEARDAGIKLGIASSSKRSWIDKYIAKLGIADFFETICTADDVANVKPDPALYVLALNKLGVQPHEAFAVEDSPNGARAAAAAGITTLIVPNPLTRLLAFDDSELLIHAESLADIQLINLVK